MEKPFETRLEIALFQRVFSLSAVQNLAHHVMGWDEAVLRCLLIRYAICLQQHKEIPVPE